MKKIFISFLLIVAITGCSTETPDNPNAKFIKGENGDWIFNFTADEFVEKWTSDPFFKDTDFEVGSDESTAWMIDKDNVHIILQLVEKPPLGRLFYKLTPFLAAKPPKTKIGQSLALPRF